MRCPSPSYRTLFFLTATLTVAAAAVSFVSVRRLEAAHKENAALGEVITIRESYARHLDHNHDFTVTNYGFTYQGRSGTLIDDSILRFGGWEKPMLFFMEDYVRATKAESTAFIDVGANTGNHSLFMSTRVQEVHAVEPFPPILKRLYGNIALNKFTNVKVHEVAFGEREAMLPFFAPDEDNHGNGSFHNADRKGKQVGEFKVIAGDEYFKTVPLAPVSVIKIDIEGYEEPCLKGLRRTMEQHRPMLVVEVTVPPQGTIGSFEQLKGLFPANYEFLYISDDYVQLLSGQYELKEFAPFADEFFRTKTLTNIVAVPAEKLAATPRKRAGK
jgi:FkbM family methyltransferase